VSDYTEKRKRLRARGLAGTVSSVRLGLGMYTQPDPQRVLGIDTSHWTGIVDWAAAREGGIRFAIVKFMDGKVRTACAEPNYRGAVDAGMLVGSYLWLRHPDEASPGGQAREYAMMLRDHPVHIPPAIDFEWSPRGRRFNCGVADLYGCVAPFIDAHQRLPMIYTAPGYWDQYGSRSAYWGSLALWQAQYAVSPQRLVPWATWTFWQFTETGEGARYGVPADGERAVDLDYWRGTLPELRAWCAAAQDATPHVVRRYPRRLLSAAARRSLTLHAA
jgi:GH25 family lysozyme M1 (1,4-beta-N-acetylmuramidase)